MHGSCAAAMLCRRSRAVMFTCRWCCWCVTITSQQHSYAIENYFVWGCKALLVDDKTAAHASCWSFSPSASLFSRCRGVKASLILDEHVLQFVSQFCLCMGVFLTLEIAGMCLQLQLLTASFQGTDCEAFGMPARLQHPFYMIMFAVPGRVVLYRHAKHGRGCC